MADLQSITDMHIAAVEQAASNWSAQPPPSNKINSLRAAAGEGFKITTKGLANAASLPSPASVIKGIGNSIKLASPSKERLHDASIFNILDVSPKEIARQLALIDSDRFRRIERAELASMAWTGPDKAIKAPNIVSMTQQFNKTALWITQEILDASKIKRRFQLICHFIAVAKEYNDFDGLRSIIAAMQSTPVHRLERTWAMVGRREKAVFDNLVTLMSPQNNSEIYRRKLTSIKPPAVPYLGMMQVFTSGQRASNIDPAGAHRKERDDFTRVQQTLEREAQASWFISYFTLLIVSIKRNLSVFFDQFEALLDEIARYQSTSVYPFEALPVVQDAIQSFRYIPEMLSVTEQEHYRRSCEVEPKGRTTTTAAAEPRKVRAVTVGSAAVVAALDLNIGGKGARRNVRQRGESEIRRSRRGAFMRASEVVAALDLDVRAEDGGRSLHQRDDSERETRARRTFSVEFYNGSLGDQRGTGVGQGGGTSSDGSADSLKADAMGYGLWGEDVSDSMKSMTVPSKWKQTQGAMKMGHRRSKSGSGTLVKPGGSEVIGAWTKQGSREALYSMPSYSTVVGTTGKEDYRTEMLLNEGDEAYGMAGKSNDVSATHQRESGRKVCRSSEDNTDSGKPRPSSHRKELSWGASYAPFQRKSSTPTLTAANSANVGTPPSMRIAASSPLYADKSYLYSPVSPRSSRTIFSDSPISTPLRASTPTVFVQPKMQGHLRKKEETLEDGSRARNRKWTSVYVVLDGDTLVMYPPTSPDGQAPEDGGADFSFKPGERGSRMRSEGGGAGLGELGRTMSNFGEGDGPVALGKSALSKSVATLAGSKGLGGGSFLRKGGFGSLATSLNTVGTKGTNDRGRDDDGSKVKTLHGSSESLSPLTFGIDVPTVHSNYSPQIDNHR
ncbi:RasGEF [Borealophlyctis nickersoniae]|nr:RasGEF [Borealophlyctis nickersoniae]